jgi:hypothetical protein
MIIDAVSVNPNIAQKYTRQRRLQPLTADNENSLRTHSIDTLRSEDHSGNIVAVFRLETVDPSIRNESKQLRRAKGLQSKPGYDHRFTTLHQEILQPKEESI